MTMQTQTTTKKKLYRKKSSKEIKLEIQQWWKTKKSKNIKTIKIKTKQPVPENLSTELFKSLTCLLLLIVKKS